MISMLSKVLADRRTLLLHLASVGIAAFLLQGCAIAPGMSAQNTDSAEIESGRTIQVTPITSSLLDRMAMEHVSEAREVATKFAEPRENYRIGPGDVLQITVWDHPELTIPAGSFRDPESSGQQVGDDGNLFYPYVGVLKVEGMTAFELREVLTEQLSAYIMNPQLDVRIVAYRSQKVYVVGEVHRQGVLPLDDVPMMVADAISLSGGLTDSAHKSGVNISRGGEVYEIDLRALYDFADFSQNLALKHGDIVNVLDRSQQKVIVLGEVNRPATVEIVNGHLSLAATLGEVGGVNQQSADAGRIFVIRGSEQEDPTVFHLDADQAYGLVLAERFEMRAQDIVFVDTAGVSSWNKVISQLLPSISIIGIADNVAQ